MTLTGVVPERGAKLYPRWIAIWKVGQSGVIHEPLPMTAHTPKQEALAYAALNPPKWRHL